MYKYIGCKIEVFAYKYNAFKHIGGKVRTFTYNIFLVDVCEGNMKQVLDTGYNHSVLASTVGNIEHC